MNNIVKLISNDLLLDPRYIENIISKANFYYRDYTIPKRKGGKRQISQAGAELKTLQYWVVEKLLSKLPVSNYAYAYKKRSSIKKHAEFHAGAKHLLHADVYNFFNSITPEMLLPYLKGSSILKDLGCEKKEDIEIINKICFRSDILCIGTVSSPIISNIIMYNFDIKISEFCERNNLKYSRYADDFYISSNDYIDKSILSLIEKELCEIGLTLNKEKTFFVSKKYRQRVTGIVLTNDKKVSLGKAKRDNIKKQIYDKLIHKKGDPNSIMGYLAYLKDVEPNTYNNYIIKYSQYCKGDPIEEIRKNNG